MGGSLSKIIPNEVKDFANSDIGKVAMLAAPFVIPGLPPGLGDTAGAAAGGAGAAEAGAFANAMENIGLSEASGGALTTAGGALVPAAGAAAAGTAFDQAMENIGLSEASGGALTTAGGNLVPAAANALGIGGGARVPGVGPSAGPTAPAVPAGAPAGGGGVPTAGAAAPAGAGGAATAGTGGGIVDSIMKQMKDNALALGLIGGSTMLAAGQRPQIPNQQQLQSLGGDAAATAHQLITQYQSGQLAPGQQASLDQLAQNTKNQLKQYFASIGQSDSTAAVQAMAQVDQSVMGMKQQMLDSALQQGLQAIGVAQGPLNTIAQYQLGQDQNLRQAFGNFATGVGTLFGRGSGTPAPTGTATTPTATPTVTSVQQ